MNNNGTKTIDNLLGNFDDTGGISEKLMRSLMTQCAKSYAREAPVNLFIDHKLDDNPYLSKYGSDWEEEIEKVSMIPSYLSVADIVIHI